jgi:hypothetical protein
MSSSGGGLFDERRDSTSLGAFVFGADPSPSLAKDKHMKRVAVLLLLLSVAIAAPAFARGSHSSGSHSRAARGVARNKHVSDLRKPDSTATGFVKYKSIPFS